MRKAEIPGDRMDNITRSTTPVFTSNCQIRPVDLLSQSAVEVVASRLLIAIPVAIKPAMITAKSSSQPQ